MNLNDIMNLRKIFANRGECVISVKLALKIIRFKKETAAEAAFYKERYARIVNDCARIDDDGNFVFADDGCILLKPERVEDFRSRMYELDEAETDSFIDLTEEDLSELKLTLAEMEKIGDIMNRGEENGRSDH